MTGRRPKGNRQSGFTLLEVLITAVIIAFGLLSLAALQAKMVTTQMEAYQRAHALVLLEDMVARINTQRQAARGGAYATTGADTGLGSGDGYDASAGCAGMSEPARDLCEWSAALKGAATQQGGQFLGAMIGARGCIERTGSDPAAFRVSVAWQGLTETVAPAAALTCGAGAYGDETLRRVLAAQVTLADLN
ncbi:MAG: type IV pilus modification protein PilV [Thiocapsa sp.]|nr:type IV pilus modification protein PilV [Thiocapsa sp.]MCG6985306.1 type IV pilus modification protein PilV [Thiocapsa sp.]